MTRGGTISSSSSEKSSLTGKTGVVLKISCSVTTRRTDSCFLSLILSSRIAFRVFRRNAIVRWHETSAFQNLIDILHIISKSQDRNLWYDHPVKLKTVISRMHVSTIVVPVLSRYLHIGSINRFPKEPPAENKYPCQSRLRGARWDAKALAEMRKTANPSNRHRFFSICLYRNRTIPIIPNMIGISRETIPRYWRRNWTMIVPIRPQRLKKPFPLLPNDA